MDAFNLLVLRPVYACSLCVMGEAEMKVQHFTVASSLCYLWQIVLVWLILPYESSFHPYSSVPLQDCLATTDILCWKLQQ